MSNIKDDVKAAIEEFGELAFERFEWNSIEFGFLPFENHNEFITRHDWITIRLKALPKLFAHDVKIYGDDAYLMWQYYDDLARDINGDRIFYVNFTSNSEVNNCSKYFRLRRKTSAALPFDLERAKAGDVVEVLCDGKWHEMKSTEKRFTEINAIDILIEKTGCFPQRNLISELRMKYPKKVQFGAWNAKT